MDPVDTSPAMPSAPQPNETGAPAAGGRQAAAMGHHAARGFSLYLVQLIASKIINVVGQVILAWLLGTTDYGFVGLAFTVAMFVSLIQQAGVREVLIQRGTRFDRWAGAAFWISAATGTLGTLLMLAAAPLAAWFYKDPRLTNMILCLVPNGLLFALAAVPEAKLAIDLRFRALASLSFVFGSISMGLSIVLAALGFGAYSFIIPMPVVAALRLIAVWMLVRPGLHLRIPLRRMRFLFGDNVLMLSSTFLQTIQWQGDYIILGRMYSKDVVGLYYWAFNLSLQSVYLLAETMSGVLFPSLSRLSAEPARQRDGLLRAVQAIALVGIPAALVQAALASPVVHLLFKPQWFPGIPIIQLLSIGMAFHVIGSPSFIALKAQGRFGLVLCVTAAYAAQFMLLGYFGARVWGANGMAAAVALHLCVSTMISTYAALRTGPRIRDMVSIFGTPLLAGGLAAAAAMSVASMMHGQTKVDWALRTLAGGLAALAVYLPLARTLSRQTWDELARRINDLLRRFRPVASA